MPTIEDRVVNAIATQFAVSVDELTDMTRRGDLERWDSLGHLELIEVLRTEFDVEIAPEDALDMETVADIKLIMGKLMNGHGE